MLGLHELELRKFQGNQERLLLALASELLNWMFPYFHIQVIFMDSLGGVLQHAVFFQVFPQQL